MGERRDLVLVVVAAAGDERRSLEREREAAIGTASGGGEIR